MKQKQAGADEGTAALLRVASYLSRPQRFLAVADARAELRSTLALAVQGSVILTTHGEPEVAVVPFATLEDMRSALLHLLVEEMGASFALAQKSVQSQQSDVPTASGDDDLERLVDEVVRRGRGRRAVSLRKLSRA